MSKYHVINVNEVIIALIHEAMCTCFTNSIEGNYSVIIFPQEKAVKWYVGEEIDGLTTNGVFITKPQEGFYPPGKPEVWREVSVGGAIYPLRESRSAPLKTNQV